MQLGPEPVAFRFKSASLGFAFHLREGEGNVGRHLFEQFDFLGVEETRLRSIQDEAADDVAIVANGEARRGVEFALQSLRAPRVHARIAVHVVADHGAPFADGGPPGAAADRFIARGNLYPLEKAFIDAGIGYRIDHLRFPIGEANPGHAKPPEFDGDLANAGE